MAKLRDRLQSENINIDEFVEEFDHNLKIMDSSGLLPSETMSRLHSFKKEMKENKDISEQQVDKTISDSMGFKKGVSFVDRTVSIIKQEKGKQLNDRDAQAQIGMADTFDELASKALDPLGLMKGTANHIRKNVGNRGTGKILDTIPKDSQGQSKIDEILQYGKDHAGVRKEAKKPLERLLEDAKAQGKESALSRLTYEQLDKGVGLSENEENSFRGSKEQNEPDSPPAGTVLKSWVEGYKKEQQEQSNAQSRAA